MPLKTIFNPAGAEKLGADLDHSLLELGAEERREQAEDRRGERPRHIGDQHDRPHATKLPNVLEREIGHDRQDDCNGVLGEELLARKHDHQEADRIAEAGDQRPPRGIRQMRLQHGLGEQREAHRDAGGNAGPPQRKEWANHLLVADPAHNLVDDRRAWA
jgi:hypothetical protein